QRRTARIPCRFCPEHVSELLHGHVDRTVIENRIAGFAQYTAVHLIDDAFEIDRNRLVLTFGPSTAAEQQQQGSGHADDQPLSLHSVTSPCAPRLKLAANCGA